MKRKQINGIQIMKRKDGYLLRVAKTKEIIKTVSTYKEAVDYAFLNHEHLDPRPIVNKRMANRDFTYELNYKKPYILL